MGLDLDKKKWKLFGTLSWGEILSAWGFWTKICQIQLGGIRKQTTSSHPTSQVEAETTLGEMHIGDAILQPGWGGLIIQSQGFVLFCVFLF